jgi:hypothetical protein
MTLKGLNLTAGMVALTTMAVVACADAPAADPGFTPSAAPSGFTAPVDPATATSPPTPGLPEAPPEIPPEGVSSPSEQIDPDDPLPAPPPSPQDRPPG